MFIKNNIFKIIFLSFFIFFLFSCEPNESTLLSKKDICFNIDCSGHGKCEDNNHKAVCVCDEGYHADGFECVDSECSRNEDCGLNERCTNSFSCECKLGYQKYKNECLAFDKVIQFGELNFDDSVTDIKIIEDKVYVIGNYLVQDYSQNSRPFIMSFNTEFNTSYAIAGNDFVTNSITFDRFDIRDDKIYILGTAFDKKTGYFYSDISIFDLDKNKLEYENKHSFEEKRICNKNSDCNSTELCEKENIDCSDNCEKICKYLSINDNCINDCIEGQSRCFDKEILFKCDDGCWKPILCDSGNNCVADDTYGDKCAADGTPYKRKYNGIVFHSGIIIYDTYKLFYSGYYSNNVEIPVYKKFSSFINFSENENATEEYIIPDEKLNLISTDMIKIDRGLVMLSNTTKVADKNAKIYPYLTFLYFNGNTKTNIKLKEKDDLNMFLNSIIENNEGDFYAVGDIAEENNPNSIDNIIVKINGNTGKISKTYKYGTHEIDEAVKVAIDNNDNIYVVGYTDGNLMGNETIGSRDIFLSKLDKNLNMKWTTQFGTKRADIPKDIVLDDNNIWIVGETEGSFSKEYTNQGKADVFIMKIKR